MFRCWLWLSVVIIGNPVFAQNKDRFPEAHTEKGQLRYIETIPVLTVRGQPSEIGQQFGILAVKNAPNLTGLRNAFLQDAGQAGRGWIFDVMARRLLPGFPADHRTEIEAAALSSGRPLDDLLFANTIYDLSRGMGCSTITIEKSRSQTNAVLLGRNLDWLPSAGITAHTLVAIFQPEGKHRFAIVTISPIAGCLSGMNDAGVCCTINAIHLKDSKDQSSFQWDGTPMLLAFRRILEECSSIEDAIRLLRGCKRTCAACLTICDRHGGAVVEITPKTIAVRHPTAGMCFCTNHFESESLCMDKEKCPRMTTLKECVGQSSKLGVQDVFQQLHQVHQGKYTIQSMVFEPEEQILHLKISDEKTAATTHPTVRLMLKSLWQNQ